MITLKYSSVFTINTLVRCVSSGLYAVEICKVWAPVNEEAMKRGNWSQSLILFGEQFLTIEAAEKFQKSQFFKSVYKAAISMQRKQKHS